MSQYLQNDRTHEILALITLRKLDLQARIHSNPLGLHIWFFGQTFRLLPYVKFANSEGSGETAQMRSLTWAFAGRLCDKHHNLMTWLMFTVPRETVRSSLLLRLLPNSTILQEMSAYELPHNKMTCAPSIRSVFAVRMKKHWALNYLLSAQWRLIKLGGCPGWTESSLCAHHFVVLRLISFFFSQAHLYPVTSFMVCLCLTQQASGEGGAGIKLVNHMNMIGTTKWS